MLKSKATAKKSSKPASETAFLTMPQSSETSALHYLPANCTSLEDWLTSLRQDSLASPIAMPDDARELTTAVISGRKPLNAFARWHPITSCWRTFQASFLTNMLEPLSGSWLKSGMTVSGTAYRLRQLVPHTSVGAGGVWHIPRAWMANEAMPKNSTYINTIEYQAMIVWPINIMKLENGRHWLGTLQDGIESLKGSPNLPQFSHEHFHLNPMFMEWLMGLPIGWTDLKPLATESYRQWLQSF